MKIRTDFVTNSSSSSFSLLVKIQDKADNEYSFSVSPYNCDTGGACCFDGKLEDLRFEEPEEDWRLIGVCKGLIQRGKEEAEINAGRVSVGDELKIIPVLGCAVQLSYQTWKVYPTESIAEEGAVYDSLDKEGIIPIDVDHGLLKAEKDGKEIGFLPPRFYSDVYNEEYWSVIGKGKYYLKAVVTDIIHDKKKDTMRIIVSIYIKQEYEILDSVADLAKYLMDHSYDSERDHCTEELERIAEEEDSDYDWKVLEERKKTEQEKQNFIKNVTDKIKSLDDIKKVIIKRDYMATGEEAILIAEGDKKLLALAKKVVKASADKKKAALDEMREYINTPHPEICEGAWDSFPHNSNEFRYWWDGTDEQLLEIAKTLNKGKVLSGCKEGVEYIELDMESGVVDSYAAMYLV